MLRTMTAPTMVRVGDSTYDFAANFYLDQIYITNDPNTPGLYLPSSADLSFTADRARIGHAVVIHDPMVTVDGETDLKLLEWDMETTAANYPGGKTFTLNSAAALTTAQVLKGTNALAITSTNDYARAPITAGDIFNPTSGTVIFSFYSTGYNRYIFEIRDSTQPNLEDIETLESCFLRL